MMSTLITALDEYLSLRRRLGFKLEKEGRTLPKYVSFLGEHGKSYITTDLAVRWASNPPREGSPAQVGRRLSMVRLFAEYISATDPRNEVPSKTLLPGRFHRKPPFLYTDEQVVRLLKAARQLPSKCRPAQNLRARTYSTLLGLLSVTGMRIGEIIALDRDDVDFDQGVLPIRGAKFGKSRLVPLHPTAQRVLRQYADSRDRSYPRPQTQAFFVSARGVRMLASAVRFTFNRLSRKTGLRGPSDRYGPRLHDFRHRFATRALLRWYQDGADVEKHILELSTFLGHVNVSNTYWYLTAVPELLQLAAARADSVRGGVWS